MNHFILALKLILLISIIALAVPIGIIIYAVLLFYDPFTNFVEYLKKDIASNLDDSNFSNKVRNVLEWL